MPIPTILPSIPEKTPVLRVVPANSVQIKAVRSDEDLRNLINNISHMQKGVIVGQKIYVEGEK